MSTGKFDDLLTTLGTGRWNFIFFLADCLSELLYPPQYISGVYLAPDVGHTCLPPEGLNVSSISDDSCVYYMNITSDGENFSEPFPCTDWEFDNSTYISTLTSEFKLVCGSAYLRATYQSLPIIGIILTSSTIGYLSDKYGRKTIIVFTQVTHSILAFSIVFASNISAILALRFIQGCVTMNTLYALAIEVCEVKQRAFVGILIALPWAFGVMAFGGLAYFIRDWRTLHICASAPLFLRIIFHFFLDESPRWLILKGKHDRALNIVKKAARLNKSILPSDAELKKVFLEIQNEQSNAETQIVDRDSKKGRRHWRDYIPTLIRTPKLRRRTLTLSTIMLTTGLVYTGLTLSGDSYSSDPFLYIVLSGLADVPAFTISAPVINWLGRKRPACGCFFICGIVVLALNFIPKDLSWVLMTLAMLGKLCNAIAFMILFVYMNELFPTEVRMQGVGFIVATDCMGSTIAPYITNYLGPMVPWLPSVLFGLSSFLACVLFLPLPETLGKPMIETVEDLEGNTYKQDKYPDEFKEVKNRSTTPFIGSCKA